MQMIIDYLHVMSMNLVATLSRRYEKQLQPSYSPSIYNHVTLDIFVFSLEH